MIEQILTWYTPEEKTPEFERSCLFRYHEGGLLASYLQDDSEYGLVIPDYESYTGLNEIKEWCYMGDGVWLDLEKWMFEKRWMDYKQGCCSEEDSEYFQKIEREALANKTDKVYLKPDTGKGYF